MRQTVLSLSLLMMPVGAPALESSSGPIEVAEMAGDLIEPWGIAFLPEGGWIISERDGRLLNFADDGTRQEVSGLPAIHVVGQGGLLDVMVPRDFAETREVFLSYAAELDGGGTGTKLSVGRLSEDGSRLEDVRVLFGMSPGSNGGRHFGSRIVEAPDGTLFVTVGERGDRPSAQDLSRHNGSVIRINRDGSLPEDNPFVDTNDALPEIWSYGHRNPQGAALDGDGRLWVNEHGAQGGDEINLIRKGANYGWPEISYGVHYSGETIGAGTEQPGMEQPALYWDPSIAPSGMMFYSGALWPDWEGDIFVGSLKFGMISRLDVSGDSVTEAERIEGAETERVRDIVEAPDGSIWFLSVGQGAAYRMTPG